MNKMIILLFVLSILFTLNVCALTLTVEKSRVYSPEEQQIKVDFNKLAPNWQEVYLKIEIFGSATFKDGKKVKEYSYGSLDQNIVLDEVIALNVENPNLEEAIMVKANMKYTIVGPWGFSKTNEPTASTSFIGIWTEKAQCQEQLRQCGDSEKMLQEENNQLNNQIGKLNSQVITLTTDKGSLENRVIDLESQLDICNTTKTVLEQRSPENGCDSINLLGISIPSILLVIVLVWGGLWIWSLKKENDELKGQHHWSK